MDPLRSYDLNLLVVLGALLETGSVTQAARQLGMSPSAVSHALSRARDQLGDPLFVRAGRSLSPTDRARRLQPQLNKVLDDITRLVVQQELDVAALQRRFVVHATDHVLSLIGVPLDRALSNQAPAVDLSVYPVTVADPELLRTGRLDISIGIWRQLPPELISRPLFDDRFVCVVRRDHPHISDPVTLDLYTRLTHIQVAPRGKPGGLVDRLLEDQGHRRRIATTVPFFASAIELVAQSDHVLTISERLAVKNEARWNLRLFPPPLAIPSYTLRLLWHPRSDSDPAHAWFRQLLIDLADDLPALD